MIANWPVRQEFDLYAPAHLVLHLPFALLPYRVALTVYLFVLLAALMTLAAVASRAVRLPGGPLAATFVGACVVGSQLGKSAVYLGQVNPLIALGGVLALTRFRDAPRLAAAGLAVAWIKPQYGIPLTLLLLARGAWRPALGGTAAVTVLSLPVAVLLVVREGGIGAFVDVVRTNLDFARATSYGALDNPDLGRVDLGAVLFRLTGRQPPAVELIVVVAVLGLSAWIVAGPARRGLPFDVPELAVVTVAVLVALVHQQGESLLTLPVVVGVVAWWRARVTGEPGSDEPGSDEPGSDEPGSDERPPIPMIVAAALLCVPALHVSAAAALVRATLGTRADTLVDALALLIAFGAGAVVAARRRGRTGGTPW
jgi:hypothetical protein